MKSSGTPVRDTYHHGDLRRALLDTALRLVAERGPEGFSLREAAREVGVSPAAAYRHFTDKPTLLATLAAEGHQRLAEAMERAGGRVREGQPRARAVAVLAAIGQAYVEFAVKNPSFFRVMFNPSALDPASGPCADLAPSFDVLTRTLDALVTTGALAPELRPGAEILAWSTVHGLSTLLVDGAIPFGPTQRAEAYRHVSRGILLGLGCDPALVPPPRPGPDCDPHQLLRAKRGDRRC